MFREDAKDAAKIIRVRLPVIANRMKATVLSHFPVDISMLIKERFIAGT